MYEVFLILQLNSQRQQRSQALSIRKITENIAQSAYVLRSVAWLQKALQHGTVKQIRLKTFGALSFPPVASCAGKFCDKTFLGQRTCPAKFDYSYDETPSCSFSQKKSGGTWPSCFHIFLNCIVVPSISLLFIFFESEWAWSSCFHVFPSCIVVP